MKNNFNRFEIVTYVLSFLIFIVLVVGVFSLEGNLKNNKVILEKYKYDKLIVTNPLKIDIPDTSIANIILNKENVAIVNAHLNYISSKNEEVIELSHKVIDNDIDRLNTFMALGIGLLGLIGIILPIVTTFFQTEALKSQISNFEEKFKKHDLDEISKNVRNILIKVPKVEVLTLLYYVSRFINIDKDDDKDRDKTYSDTLYGIIDGFRSCGSEGINSDTFFKEALKDFQRGLKKHQTILGSLTENRKGQENVTKLEHEVSELLNERSTIERVIMCIKEFLKKDQK